MFGIFLIFATVFLYEQSLGLSKKDRLEMMSDISTCKYNWKIWSDDLFKEMERESIFKKLTKND